MGTMQWLQHFESSVNRARPVHWEAGVSLSDEVRMPVVRLLKVFQRGLNSPGLDLRKKVRRSEDEAYARCIDLYVQEKNVHSEMLIRVIWELGSEPSKREWLDFAFRRFRRRFDWAPELMILLTAEMASMPFFRVLSNQVDSEPMREVLEHVMQDQAYHLGFHIDHLRSYFERGSDVERIALNQGWAVLFGAVLSGLLAYHGDVFKALKYDRLAFWSDAWNLFAQVQTGLHGSANLAHVLARDPRLRFAI